MIREIFCQYAPEGEGQCGAKIDYIGYGKPPKYCATCMKTYNIHGNASRRLDVTVGPATDQAVANTVRDMGLLQAISRQAGRVQRLAIGLASEDDPERAAALAGVTYSSPEELAGLVAQAQDDQYKALRELQPAAMSGLIMQTIGLLLVNARESAAGGGSPSQTIAGIKGLVQSLEMLTGGASSVYGDVTVIFPGSVESDE